MSLTAIHGAAIEPLVRPSLNWTDVPADRLERLELMPGPLEDERFPGGIIPRAQSGVMRYYAVASSRAMAAMSAIATSCHRLDDHGLHRSECPVR